MATIPCPNCGKSNPDLLDVCQFCQTPLKSDSILRSGEKPTKKHTGDLESALPDWLKNIQQQAKDAADEEAAQAAASPAPQSNEPPDLLAGLASQANSAEEDDIPDWLASINPSAKSKPSTPAAPEPANDIFATLNQNESKPEQVSEAPEEEDIPSWMNEMRDSSPASAEKDELSTWFSQASDRTEDVIESEDRNDMGWGANFDSPSVSPQQAAPKEEENLDWLHNLEAAARQTGELQTPRLERDWTADFETPSASPTSSSSQDDLSWLDRLGGIEEPPQPAPEQTATPQDDLGWLDQFSGISEPAQPSPPPAAQEDLSWLNNLGAASEQPVDAAPDQPVPTPPFASQPAPDLDWLNTLGATPEPAPSFDLPEDKQPSEEDLSWLNDLGKPSQPVEPATSHPFTEADLGTDRVSPKQTSPLNPEAIEENQPDWLKSATKAPSMPAPGNLSMDWFTGTSQAEKESTPPSTPQAAPLDSDIFSVPSESATLSNQDVDSLFSVEMPDWLSRSEPETTESASPRAEVVPSEGDELTPVDLPSWVQAMRPVEAVITETASGVADQPAETQGPLAGLHGVIPLAPVGTSRKPKAVSLTLQVSEDQQASALLLEQILGSETSPRALITSSVVTSQHWLRWVLAALFLLVLSSVIVLRSQMMPVSATLPNEVGDLSNAVMSIPANSRILVVVDYEPSLAGEMEAVSGPLLDQIVLLSQPNLSFVSTSPNGVALAERLMANTGINPSSAQVLNLGFLPGGPAGVLGFIEAPGQIIPAAGVQSLAEYSALIVLTDQAESGRVWVEQLQNRKGMDPVLANQPLLVVSSAQAGPLLQPYVSSRQITGMISGLSGAARYESMNNNRPGIARSYWDTFGAGLMLAIALIVIGSLWSLFTGIRARRATAEQG